VVLLEKSKGISRKLYSPKNTDKYGSGEGSIPQDTHSFPGGKNHTKGNIMIGRSSVSPQTHKNLFYGVTILPHTYQEGLRGDYFGRAQAGIAKGIEERVPKNIQIPLSQETQKAGLKILTGENWYGPHMCLVKSEAQRTSLRGGIARRRVQWDNSRKIEGRSPAGRNQDIRS